MNELRTQHFHTLCNIETSEQGIQFQSLTSQGKSRFYTLMITDDKFICRSLLVWSVILSNMGYGLNTPMSIPISVLKSYNMFQVPEP